MWDIWYPPNGFGCRCMVVSRTEEQVRRMGLTVEQALPDTSNMATGETEALHAGPEVPDEPGEGGVEAGPGCVPTGLKEAVPGTAEGA
ncbi:MAG: hypothetical protein ACLTW9_02350 [Enterocloster sp.]